MKTKHWIITGTLITIVVSVIMVFRPVPIPEEKDCISLKGTIATVYEGSSGDVVFRLQDQQQTFYINRGLERGLRLDNLQATLTNREVVIKYPEYWTPLDPNNQIRHISKIEYEGETIFSELD